MLAKYLRLLKGARRLDERHTAFYYRVAKPTLVKLQLVWQSGAGQALFAFTVLLIGLLGMLSFLSIAGLRFPPPFHLEWLTLAYPASDQFKSQLVSAGLAWFGGTAALTTFLLTRDQKERHNRGQEKRERELAELQRLESEFSNIVQGLASESVLVQKISVKGISEIAVKPDPRQVSEAGELYYVPRSIVCLHDFSIDRQVVPLRREWRSQKNAQNFPYFLRAVDRLVACITHWEHTASKASAFAALAELGNWAKDDLPTETDEPLLHDLVNKAADLNRNCWESAKESVVEYLLAGGSIERVLECFGCIFSDHDGHETTKANERVNSLRAVSTFLESEFKSVTDTSEKTSITESTDSKLLRLKSDVEVFLLSQNTLASLLQRLSYCVEYLEVPINPQYHRYSPQYAISDEEWKKTFASFKQALSECSYNGDTSIRIRTRRKLNLTCVQLFGTNCSLVCFVGANCEDANFIGANLSCSDFSFSNCSGASFMGSDISMANFMLADCSWAIFMGVTGSWSSFCKTNCRGARFESALLWGSLILLSDFRSSNLNGVFLGGTDGYPAAVVVDTDFSDSTFVREDDTQL